MKKLALIFLAITTCISYSCKKDKSSSLKTTDFREQYTGSYRMHIYEEKITFKDTTILYPIRTDTSYDRWITILYNKDDKVLYKMHPDQYLPALSLYDTKSYAFIENVGVDDSGRLFRPYIYYPGWGLEAFGGFISKDSIWVTFEKPLQAHFYSKDILTGYRLLLK